VGRALLLAASAVALFAAGSLWLALYPPVPIDLDGAPNLDAAAERVAIPVDGDRLDGWVLAGPRRAVVIVLHGYGRDHTRAWRYGAFLRRAGYDVVTADLRSSRERDRRPTTLGAYELEDAQAILDWVRREPRFRRHRIGLLGESLGGSVALVLAARNPDVACVLADCPFARGRDALGDAVERRLRLPRRPAADVARWLGRRLTGRDPGALDAVAAADSLRDRPLLLIHARNDDRIAADRAQEIWRAAGAKDERWLADGGHNEAWQRYRREYEARALAFFERGLRPAAQPAAAQSVAPPRRRPRAAG
jgi:dienelactone hydrolase